jgi:hypothetical protein
LSQHLRGDPTAPERRQDAVPDVPTLSQEEIVEAMADRDPPDEVIVALGDEEGRRYRSIGMSVPSRFRLS